VCSGLWVGLPIATLEFTGAVASPSAIGSLDGLLVLLGFFVFEGLFEAFEGFIVLVDGLSLAPALASFGVLLGFFVLEGLFEAFEGFIVLVDGLSLAPALTSFGFLFGFIVLDGLFDAFEGFIEGWKHLEGVLPRQLGIIGDAGPGQLGIIDDPRLGQLGIIGDAGPGQLGIIDDPRLGQLGIIDDPRLGQLGIIDDPRLGQLGIIDDPRLGQLGIIDDPRLGQLGIIDDPRLGQLGDIDTPGDFMQAVVGLADVGALTGEDAGVAARTSVGATAWADARLEVASRSTAAACSLSPGSRLSWGFDCMFTYFRSVILTGTSPLKRLDWMSKYCNETKFCTLVGIFPLIWLNPMSSFVKLLKLPIEDGRVPFSDFDEMFISTTDA
jgi:hypothetical protein